MTDGAQFPLLTRGESPRTMDQSSSRDRFGFRLVARGAASLLITAAVGLTVIRIASFFGRGQWLSSSRVAPWACSPFSRAMGCLSSKPDGRYASGDAPSVVGADAGRAMAPAHGGAGVSWLCAAGAGRILSGGQDGSAAVTSWRDGAVTHSWKAHAKPVTRVAHLPRSGDVLTAGRDGLVKLWSLGDAGDAAMRRECVGHDLTVSGLAELEDLGLACSGSRDYTVRAWDLETARCTAVAKISRNVVTNLRRVPREPVVAQTSEDLRVRLWDVRDLTTPAATFEGHVDIPHCVDVTPDGNYLVTSSNGFDATSGCELRVWDRRAGRQILEARRHCASVNACAFAAGENAKPPGFRPGSLVVVSGSTDRTVRAWIADAALASMESTDERRFDGYDDPTEAAATTCVAALDEPDGCFVAAGDLAGKTQVWEVNHRGEMLARAHTR